MVLHGGAAVVLRRWSVVGPWLVRGGCVEPSWLVRGGCMLPTCCFRGACMIGPWRVRDASAVDPRWCRGGSMEGPWRVRGGSSGFTVFPLWVHGASMAPWWVYGAFILSPWRFRGDLMVSPCGRSSMLFWWREKKKQSVHRSLCISLVSGHDESSIFCCARSFFNRP